MKNRYIAFVVLIALAACAASCGRKESTAYPRPVDKGTVELAEGYVDMGLSVKWASRNLGAASATDCGTYYAWGTLDSVEGPVTEAGYKFISTSTGMYTKYTIGDELEPDDDVVAVTNQDGSRMPLWKEAEELIAGCDWEYVICNGVTGYLATSKTNGARIFFPLSGYYADGGQVNNGFSVQIWTAETSYEFNYYAYCISMSPIVKPGVGQAHRYLGINVRAVYEW